MIFKKSKQKDKKRSYFKKKTFKYLIKLIFSLIDLIKKAKTLIKLNLKHQQTNKN